MYTQCFIFIKSICGKNRVGADFIYIAGIHLYCFESSSILWRLSQWRVYCTWLPLLKECGGTPERACSMLGLLCRCPSSNDLWHLISPSVIFCKSSQILLNWFWNILVLLVNSYCIQWKVLYHLNVICISKMYCLSSFSYIFVVPKCWCAYCLLLAQWSVLAAVWA